MAVIADILGQIDAAAAAVGASAFDAVATQMVPVLRVGSVLVVILVGINLMVQAVPMTLRNGLGLAVRISVASAFLSSWTNFNAVYGTLTNAPSEIGAVVMNAFGDGTGNLYEGLDALYLKSLDVGQGRILVGWTRIVTPDGQSVQMEAFGGDAQGRSGITGKVNSRFGMRFGSAALISLLGAAPAIAAAKVSDATTSDTAQNVANDLSGATSTAIDAYINLPPIISVAPGAAITVMVDRDLEIY